MKNAHLGTLEVSRIGLGAMTMAGTYTSEGALDDAESIRTIHRALDLGVTHIDTAEIYGPFLSEEIVGEAVKGRRDQVEIATKFGLVSHAGGGPGVDRQQPRERQGRGRRLAQAPGHRPHRPATTSTASTRTPRSRRPRGAVADLIAEGKVLHFGLSEASPETIRRAHAVQPVSALQTEYSLWTRDVEAEILPLLRELGIGFVPYSPLGHGLLTGQIRSVDDFADDDWRKTNPRFTGENFRRNLAHRRRGPRDRRRDRRHPRADRARVDPHPRRRHRPDPRHPPRRPRRGEHRRRRHRAHRRPARPTRQPRARRRRHATTTPTWRRSTARRQGGTARAR